MLVRLWERQVSGALEALYVSGEAMTALGQHFCGKK
jgi:hypothetical protein